jgi:hypothetical protein
MTVSVRRAKGSEMQDTGYEMRDAGGSAFEGSGP